MALLLQDELERLILSARDLLLMPPGKPAQNSAAENGNVSAAMVSQGRRGEFKDHHADVKELDGSKPKMESNGSCNTSVKSEKLHVVSFHPSAQIEFQSLTEPHGLLKRNGGDEICFCLGRSIWRSHGASTRQQSKCKQF